jgi:hypothetical protein
MPRARVDSSSRRVLVLQSHYILRAHLGLAAGSLDGVVMEGGSDGCHLGIMGRGVGCVWSRRRLLMLCVVLSYEQPDES